MCFQLFLNLLLLLAFSVNYTGTGFSNIDKTKYEAGKSEYELIERKSQLPDYGFCWKDTIISLNKDCKSVTAELQGKLALAYLNCFLKMQDLAPYSCDDSRSLADCAKSMTDSDRNSMATFFTHTQNICYFLEAQVWHDETEKTIVRLATSSEDVATQLEEASELQNEILGQQRTSIDNQKEILDKASKLGQLISNSSDNIHSMFAEFRNTTAEQRDLINDLFNKITHLQSMVIGEFTGFYSVIYYVLMLIVSYLLTSTQRTATARFWLFGIATVNFLSERFAISFVTSAMSTWSGRSIFENENDDDLIYMYQWLCRKCSGLMALVVLAISAYSYQDYNVINNQLLLDIRTQIGELRNFVPGPSANKEMVLHSSASPDSTCVELDRTELIQEQKNETQQHLVDSTGYEGSDRGSESSTSEDTDNTYVPSSLDSMESYSTCYSHSSNQTSLAEELSDIRGATPLKELAQQIDSWTKTGNYLQNSPIHSMETRTGGSSPVSNSRSRSRTPQPGSSQQSLSSPYFLRQRNYIPVWKCLMESPRRFAKTVKAMEQISQKKSEAVRYTAQRQLDLN